MSRYRPRSEYGLLLVAAGCFAGTAALVTGRTAVAAPAAGLVVGGLALMFWDHAFWDRVGRARAALGGGPRREPAEQPSPRRDRSHDGRRRPAA